MTSHTTERFRKAFQELPARIQREARKAYRLWKTNPYHASLQFKEGTYDQTSVFSARRHWLAGPRYKDGRYDGVVLDRFTCGVRQDIVSIVRVRHMRDENLIWRKDLFTTRGAHRAACSRKEVMNEEVPRRAGAHPKGAPISSSSNPPLAERARRLRMRAATRAIPQDEGARLWEGRLPALSLREDLGDCFASGPSQATSGEGLGGGLLRGLE